MAKVTQAAKVGIFVLLSAGATYLVFRVVSKEVGGGNGYIVYGLLDDATGLAKHTRVTIAGIAVGSIDDIKLQNGQARVDVRLGPETALYADARMQKKQASLLGEAIITLTPGVPPVPGDPAQGRLKDGDQVTVEHLPGTDDIIKQANDIVASVKLVAEQLARSVGTNQAGDNIKTILDNLAEATKGLNNTIKENRTVLNEALKNVAKITAEGRPELRQILENVRTITEEVKEMLIARADTGQPGELKQTVTNLSSATKTLDSVMHHVDNITSRVDKGEGTIGRLSKDETLINEIQGVAEGAGDYIGNISRLQTVVGLRADYNFLANTIKSYVELRLQPREDKYYVFELINDPRGKTTFEQQDVDTTNPTLPSHYRTVTTTTTDAFRFSLQFARRLGPFTGRFGIKESTGGIGLDLHLLSDRFEVKQDLFGFGEEVQPRYRVFIAYEFVKRLWLMGGVDHLFLPSRRDYFLGLQLRFTDEDLKTILPFAPSGAIK